MLLSPSRPLLLLTSLLLSPAGFLTAADIPPAAEVAGDAVAVITPNWSEAFVASAPKSRAYGSVEPGESGDTLKLITTDQPPRSYDLQLFARNLTPVKKGDILLLRFAARSVLADLNTGVTKLKVGFSKASPEWDVSYSGELGLGSAWQRFDIPFTSLANFAPGQARLVFTFGYPAQIAEIASVQVLNYGPDTPPASLPKTRRFADPVSAEQLQTELTRIAALRAGLAAAGDPSPAGGRVLAVSPGDSIQAAINAAGPGDTVLVAAGTYDTGRGLAFRRSGRPDAWIKLKAAPGARPRLVSSGWSGIEMRGGIAYIEVDGFELEWIADPAATDKPHGSGFAPAYASHHIRILNNVIHGFGTGGISALDCDYLHIEDNVIYDTAKTSPYGGSAISLCRAFDFDRGTGYRNVIRGNVAFDNELRVSTQVDSGGNGKFLTDGNGIIIDVFNKSRANPLKPHQQDKNGPLAPYHGRTLIENNLIHDNGGRGIHVFRSSYVDVVNNTAYQNQKSRDIQAGELTAIESSHIVFLNNIAYGRPDKRGNAQDGSTRVIWSHNLFFNTADVLLHDGIIEADPLFVAPALDAKPEGFRLRPGSPALGAGLALSAPSSSGPADLGAFQHRD